MTHNKKFLDLPSPASAERYKMPNFWNVESSLHTRSKIPKIHFSVLCTSASLRETSLRAVLRDLRVLRGKSFRPRPHLDPQNNLAPCMFRLGV